MQKNLRVLLLDDDEILSHVTAQMLEHLGCCVTTTERGEDTIAAYTSALRDNPFDVVILDLTINGGLGGENTASAILAINPQAHIIISSGFGNDPVMTNYHNYGFKNVLKKPYQLHDLTAILDPLLTKSTTETTGV